MLRTFEIAAILAAAIFFLAIIGIGFYSSLQSRNPTEQQATTEQKLGNQQQEQRIGGTTLAQWLFPDSVSVFTFWLAISTVALGIVAMFQLGFLRRAEMIADQSARAAKEASDTAKIALIATNRPWIKTEIRVGGPIVYNVNGVNFAINYVIENIGRSPATNVMVNPRVIAPAIGMENIDLRVELRKVIASQKIKVGNPFGFALFPDEVITQSVTVSIPQDELKRITQKVEFIMPTILGTISYRMGLDTEVHQTGFMFEVRRSDRLRPESTEKNRSPITIFPDEGDIPESDIRLVRSILEGGYVD